MNTRNLQALFMDEDLVSFEPRKHKIQKSARVRQADTEMLNAKRKERIRDRNRHSKSQVEFA
jgi:hypothetical protein